MARVYYNKLIRDKIPEKIKGKGEDCEVRSISDEQEFEQELLKKVTEEAQALSVVRGRNDLLNELADLAAVLDELKKLHAITDAEFSQACRTNQTEKGGFEKRLYLHWSSDSDYKSNETPQGIKHS